MGYTNKALENLNTFYETEKEKNEKIIDELEIRQSELLIRKNGSHIFYDFDEEKENEEYTLNKKSLEYRKKMLGEVIKTIDYIQMELEKNNK